MSGGDNDEMCELDVFRIIIIITIRVCIVYARARKRITGAPTTRVGVYSFHDHDNGLSFGHHRRTVL